MSLSVTRTLSLPGFVSVHSHSAARVRRGAPPDGGIAEVEAALTATYRAMRAAGITAVGEAARDDAAGATGTAGALAAARAAEAAGIVLVWLHGARTTAHGSVADYLREVDSLRADGVAVAYAVPDLRACPVGWLEEIGRAAAREGTPLHVVAHEHPSETAACRAAHGCRPAELLARAGCLGPHVLLAHMTHADGSDLDLVRAHGAAVCACPSGDAHLGNGFLPVNRMLHRQIPLCVGTDVCAIIDPLAELRELEWVARRQKGAPEVLPGELLLEVGAARGALALGLAGWPAIEIDLDHPTLVGVDPPRLAGTLVGSCGADVVGGGRP